MTGFCLLFPWQPRGLTLARIDGPVTAGVTVRERGECEITPSTDVRYPPGSTNSRKNHWLLIGKHTQTHTATLPPLLHYSHPIAMKSVQMSQVSKFSSAYFTF